MKSWKGGKRGKKEDRWRGRGRETEEEEEEGERSGRGGKPISLSFNQSIN